MQRVLKYHLLLRELMSHTASTHEEAKTIQSAYEAMLDVSDYINEVSSTFAKTDQYSEFNVEYWFFYAVT